MAPLLPDRRDGLLQSRSFARWSQSLRHSPNSNGFAEIVSDNLQYRFTHGIMSFLLSTDNVKSIGNLFQAAACINVHGIFAGIAQLVQSG